MIKNLVDELNIDNLNANVLALENEFFGHEVTVTGLLTGQDIIKNIKLIEMVLLFQAVHFVKVKIFS